jgi:hypothetical protein
MTSILTLGRDITDPVAPLAATNGAVIGALGVGGYQYKYTFRTRYGETLASPTAAVVVTLGSVDLSAIPIYPNNEVTARRIYRTTVGGSTFLFLAEITDNITTTYTDLAADGTLGAVEPIANFASTVGHFEGWHKFVRQLSRSQGAVTAAGVSLATAALIGNYEYVYAAVPVNLSGVRLPAINPNLVGLKVTINNTDMFNNLNVYPYEVTTAINGGVPGAPLAVTASFSLELICNGPSSWTYASSLTAGVAGPPSGAAGGDLTGNYPAPALVPTGVVSGSYGSPTQIPVVTFDLKGRATFATSVLADTTPGGPASGDLTGFYPAPILIGSGVVAGTYGSASDAVIIAFDSKGRATSATSVPIVALASGPAGGDLTGFFPNPVLIPSGATAGTYGSSSLVPVVAVDANGRITSITTAPVAGGPPTGIAGGALTGAYPSPLIAPTGVSPGTYTKVTVIADGRVSAAGAITASDLPALAGDITGPYDTNVVSAVQGVRATAVSADRVLMINGNSVNTGLGNTAFGIFALGINTTGERNTAFGAEALAANTINFDNTAFGSRALFVNIGDRNTAVGRNALAANTAANDSTAVGYLALAAAIGGNNTAIGSGAGALITTGSGNVIVGPAALTLTVGVNNVVLGTNADAAASATNSVVAGAGTVCGSGSGQIVVGAGAGSIASSGVNNIVLGAAAGISLTLGANNTFLGPSAGASTTTGSNNTCVGNGSATSSVGVSNEITLGNSSITRVRFATHTALPAYVDNAAAVLGGLIPGMLYRTGGDPDLVAIVH